MTEIAPTPPPNLLVNQTPAPPVPAAPLTVLPPALPVQVIALPPDLSALVQTLTLDGTLQLLLNGKASFASPSGEVTLNLPQLRANPALFQAIKNAADNQTLQLQLTPAQNGALSAQLIFPAGTGRAALPIPPQLTQLIGQQLQAIVLPAAASVAPTRSETPIPAAPPVTATPQQGTPQQNATPQNPPPNLLQPNLLQNVPAKLEQLLRPFLPPPVPASPDKIALPAVPNLNASLAGAVAGNQPVVNLRLQQIIPPGQPPPQPQPDELLVTVPPQSGNTPMPLVTVGNTSLLLKTGAALPSGTILLVKLLPPGTGELAAAPHETAETWPALRELLNSLSPAAAPALQRFAQLQLPQPNAALPGALLFVLAAMQSGDSRAWLGRSASVLLEQTGKQALLEALQSELREATGTTADPIIGEWRVYHVPVFDQNQLHPMHIYVHHNQQRAPDGSETAEPDKAQRQTRFVIDVTFTRLGKMQLDGFVKAKQFDLMLRSEQSLTPDLRQELRLAFAGALEAIGYQGQIIFQPGNQNWLFLDPLAHGNRRI